MNLATFFKHAFFGTVPEEKKNTPCIKEESLPHNIEQILQATQTCDGWRGLPFYPRVAMNKIPPYHLYLTGRDQPLVDKPIDGFEIHSPAHNTVQRYDLIIRYRK